MGNPSCPTAPVTTPKSFIDECLQVTNEYRKKHGSPPMKISDELNRAAQGWANHCASIGKMEHNNDNEDYGENIYWATGSLLTARAAVEKWYSEIEKYNWSGDRNNPQSGTGHFTQLVWKESTELGVASAQGAKGVYVVAIYNPAGNMMGDFKENVCPPA